VVKKDNSQKKLVVKSNRLIEAKSKLSIQEQRILLTAISQIQPSEEEFNKKGYAISIAEFRELADVKGMGYYSDIKEITSKLVGRTIVIKEEDGILQTSWLSSAKYVDQQGLVYLNFDERLKPYLIQLKKEFTTYKLHYIMKLKSKYSTRIYELLKQYEKIGYREFTVEQLRDIVVNERGKYSKFGDLNRNVIKKAQKEINKHTDIKFVYTLKKQGRKVVSINFDLFGSQN
jgi:plasmid replication initiation protein